MGKEHPDHATVKNVGDVQQILQELGLSQYVDAFLEQGFDTWETVLDITEFDFDALGVKLGHRRKLQRKIAESRVPALESSSSQGTDVLSQKAESSVASVANLNASTSVLKRRYRRHPKPDEHAPERPPSAYVIFSNKMRDDVKEQHLSFAQIAKLAGEKWQNCSPVDKEPFERRAAEAKDHYNAMVSVYKTTDNYRSYMEYLANFKAMQTANENAKRMKRQESSISGTSTAALSDTDSKIMQLQLINSHSSVDGLDGKQSYVASPARSESPDSASRARSEDSSLRCIESPVVPSALSTGFHGTTTFQPTQQTIFDSTPSSRPSSKDSTQRTTPINTPSLMSSTSRSQPPPRVGSLQTLPSRQSDGIPSPPRGYSSFIDSAPPPRTAMLPPLLVGSNDTPWRPPTYGVHPVPRPLEPALYMSPVPPSTSLFDVRLPSVRNMGASRDTSAAERIPLFGADRFAGVPHVMGHAPPGNDRRASEVETDAEDVADPVDALIRAGKLVEKRGWR